MRQRVPSLLASLLCLIALCSCSVGAEPKAAGRGGGVELARDAEVLFGSAFQCTSPAVVDLERAKVATAEWRTIDAEGVVPGSARYKLLMAQLRNGIRERVAALARGRNHDLVVYKGGIRDAHGLQVADLTPALLGR